MLSNTKVLPLHFVQFVLLLGIAGEARVGLDDLQVDRGGQLDADGFALVALKRQDHAVNQEIRGVAEQRCGQHRLLIGLNIHEVVQVAVVIQILNIGVIQADVLHAAAGGIRLGLVRVAADVAHLHADGGVAAAGLHMLILQHAPEIIVFNVGDTLAKVLYADHNITSPTGSLRQNLRGHAAPRRLRLRSYPAGALVSNMGQKFTARPNCAPSPAGSAAAPCASYTPAAIPGTACRNPWM